MKIRGDIWFKTVTFLFALCIPILFVGIFFMLLNQSWLSIKTFGWPFIFRSIWDPVKSQYGALPFIYGTLISSLVALLIAVPLGIGCALYLAEISRSKYKEYVATMVDMLAAIPSVVYGVWGIFVLGPIFGLSLMTGGVILAIMILPTITSISREVLQAVPRSQKESAQALGCTRWETMKLAVFPLASSGIIVAVILALGRAMGETMAVTMIIGNRPEISANLMAPGYTLASVIANEFAEAVSDLNYSVMVEIGLILMVMTFIINGLARMVTWKITNQARIK